MFQLLRDVKNDKITQVVTYSSHFQKISNKVKKTVKFYCFSMKILLTEGYQLSFSLLLYKERKVGKQTN